MSKTIKKKPRKPRNLYAIAAWFRNSAGQMGDKRKEQSRKKCRTWKRDKKEYDGD